MSEYPIIIDGERVGTLKVEQKGLLTIFDASANETGELFRISVYGGGAEGYLGVMSPENGALRFVKRLSRAAMAGFPEAIEYAGPAGAASASNDLYPQHEAEAILDTSPAEEETNTLWYSAPDGTLSSFDGRRMLVAMPTDRVNLPKGTQGVLRIINGREYIVFSR